jgi:hypothetical protein
VKPRFDIVIDADREAVSELVYDEKGKQSAGNQTGNSLLD